MGKKKYIEDVEALFDKSPVVDFKSIERIVRYKKGSRGYAKQIVRYLILNKKIKRLVKGFYTKHNDISLAVFCFKPAYLGLHDALSFHDLWEQETIPVIITPKKARSGIRKVFGLNVLIKRIDKKYFFGFDYYKSGEFYFPYSDIEKTLIDMVYFNEKVNIDFSSINREKLLKYLKKYSKKFRCKVLSLLPCD